jgi:hypothetical protein
VFGAFVDVHKALVAVHAVDFDRMCTEEVRRDVS